MFKSIINWITCRDIDEAFAKAYKDYHDWFDKVKTIDDLPPELPVGKITWGGLIEIQRLIYRDMLELYHKIKDEMPKNKNDVRT